MMYQRYRVVMIDEFQDTDPAQWQILLRVFHERSTLVLIGDPKQAIYAFRGGDVITYLAARTVAIRSRPWMTTTGPTPRWCERSPTSSPGSRWATRPSLCDPAEQSTTSHDCTTRGHRCACGRCRTRARSTTFANASAGTWCATSSPCCPAPPH